MNLELMQEQQVEELAAMRMDQDASIPRTPSTMQDESSQQEEWSVVTCEEEGKLTFCVRFCCHSQLEK